MRTVAGMRRRHLHNIFVGNPPKCAVVGEYGESAFTGSHTLILFCVPALREVVAAQPSSDVDAPEFKAIRKLFQAFDSKPQEQKVHEVNKFLEIDEHFKSSEILSSIIRICTSDFSGTNKYFEEISDAKKSLRCSMKFECRACHMFIEKRSDWVVKCVLENADSVSQAIRSSFNEEPPFCQHCNSVTKLAHTEHPEYLLINIEHSLKTTKLPLALTTKLYDDFFYGVIAFIHRDGNKFSFIVRSSDKVLHYKSGRIFNRSQAYFFRLLQGLNNGAEYPCVLLMKRMTDEEGSMGHRRFSALSQETTEYLLQNPLPRYSNQLGSCALISTTVAVAALPMEIRNAIRRQWRDTPSENEKALSIRFVEEAELDADAHLRDGFQFKSETNKKLIAALLMGGFMSARKPQNGLTGINVYQLLKELFEEVKGDCQLVVDASVDTICMDPFPGLYCFILKQKTLTMEIQRLIETWNQGDTLILFLYEDRGDDGHSMLLIRKSEKEILYTENGNFDLQKWPFLIPPSWGVQAVLHYRQDIEEQEENGEDGAVV